MSNIFETTQRQVERNIKQATRELLTGKDLNGFNWFAFDKGLHEFSKKEGDKWAHIKATPSDLTNGNIEYMTKHGLSR